MSIEENRFDNGCKPLMAAAGASLYRNNPFRITGLPIDVGTREIIKHAGKLNVMLELGQADITSQSALPLDPPPGSDQIREAIEKLKDPQTRLVHEFFWIWPEEHGNSRSDPAIQAWASGDGETALKIWTLKEDNPQTAIVATHNLAVFWHLVALDWEKNLTGTELDPEQVRMVEEYWQMSLKRWASLADNDLFWQRITHRILQIDDARLTADFCQRIRCSLPNALVKISADLSLRHVEAGRLDLASLHVRLLGELVSAPNQLQNTLDLIFSPANERLGQQIQRAKQTSETNPENALQAARDLLASAKPLFDLSRLIQSNGGHSDNDAFNQVAIVCTNCAVVHHRSTNDNRAFVSLLDQILPLVDAAELRQRIEINIAIGKTNIQRDHFQPIHEQLAKIRSSESLPRSKVWRIRDHILPQINSIPVLEKTSNPAVFELCDAVATTLKEIAMEAAQQADEIALAAIDLAFQVAFRLDLKEQLRSDRKSIQEAQAAREQSLQASARRQALIALMGKIHTLEAGHELPAAKLTHLVEQILPQSGRLSVPGFKEEAEDCLATALLKISLTAFNEHSDTDTALEAVRMATKLAHEADLRKQVEYCETQMLCIKLDQENKTLFTTIRDDTIQVTGQKIRFNDVVLATSEIEGIRFGACTKTDLKQGRRSFQIEIQASNSRHLVIDCRRFFRGEKKAQEDFDAIQRALFHHVAPLVAWRIARHVLGGKSYPLSSAFPYSFATGIAPSAEALLSADALSIQPRNGSWDQVIPLHQLTFAAGEARLSLLNKNTTDSGVPLELTNVWNAAFLDQIFDTILSAKKGQLSPYARRL